MSNYYLLGVDLLPIRGLKYQLLSSYYWNMLHFLSKYRVNKQGAHRKLRDRVVRTEGTDWHRGQATRDIHHLLLLYLFNSEPAALHINCHGHEFFHLFFAFVNREVNAIETSVCPREYLDIFVPMKRKSANIPIIALQGAKPSHRYTCCACNKLKEFRLLLLRHLRHNFPEPLYNPMVGLPAELARVPGGRGR